MNRVKLFWTPIFFKDGNLFVFVSTGFIADNEANAQIIGEMAGQGVASLIGANYTGVALEVTGYQRHVRGNLGSFPVAILSGPVFNQALMEEQRKNAVETR